MVTIPVMILTHLKTSWWWFREDWNHTMVLRVQIKSSYDLLPFKYDYCIITWITIHDSLGWIPVITGQTDRLTDTHTDGQRQMDWQTDWQPSRQIGRQTDWLTGRQRLTHAVKVLQLGKKRDSKATHWFW